MKRRVDEVNQSKQSEQKWCCTLVFRRLEYCQALEAYDG